MDLPNRAPAHDGARSCTFTDTPLHMKTHTHTHTHTQEQYTTQYIINVYNHCCCYKIKFWI